MVLSKYKPQGPEIQVACHVCRREVLLSRAISTDVKNYAVFFCSRECYQRWRKDPRYQHLDTHRSP